jgi:hypothetical protein
MVLTKMKQTAEQYLGKTVKWVWVFSGRRLQADKSYQSRSHYRACVFQ